jgi:hypothetical protein
LNWSELGIADYRTRDKLAYAAGRVFGMKNAFGLIGRIVNTWHMVQPAQIMCCLARLEYRIKHPNNLDRVDDHDYRVAYLQKCIKDFKPGNFMSTGGDDIAWDDGPDAFDKFYYMIMPEQKDKQRYSKDFTRLTDMMKGGK